MAEKLDATCTNTSNILSVSINQAHNSASSSAIVNAVTTTLEVGSSVDIDIGYTSSGNLAHIFTGYVKQIEHIVPENIYTITCNDVLIKAVDYFIASDTPDSKYSRQNVSAEDLVEDMLNLASITNYTHGTTYFTFGITRPVEVNLVSSYDFCKTVADILAWHVWADNNGLVHFEERRPYVMDSDTPQKTITTSLMTRVTHRKSDRDLRNRIVVYGAEGVNAEAEAESPYLPTGFRKSVVVASPWIDDQDMAQNAADWNLDKLNRLTEEVSLEIIGDPTIHARHVLTVTDTYTSTTGDWYVYTCEHKWGDGGFTTSMELRK